MDVGTGLAVGLGLNGTTGNSAFEVEVNPLTEFLTNSNTVPYRKTEFLTTFVETLCASIRSTWSPWSREQTFCAGKISLPSMRLKPTVFVGMSSHRRTRGLRRKRTVARAEYAGNVT